MRWSLRPSLRVTMCVLGWALLQSPTLADELKDLAEKIAENEVIYKNIELDCEDVYTLKRSLEVDDAADPKDAGLEVEFIKQQKSSTHLVVQEEMYRTTENGESETISGQSQEIDRVDTFNGEIVRRRNGNIVNLNHDRKGIEPQLTYPHEYIFANHAAGRPFSYRLLGCDVAGYHTHAVFEGNDTLEDGVKCIRIRIEMWVDGQTLRDYWLIWLRPDRNYLPAKGIAYVPGYSHKIPLQIVTVEGWKEIQPGIWLPAELRSVINDEKAAAEDKVVVSNIRKRKFSNYDLQPKYEQAYFTKFQMPKNGIVYEIKDGGIIDRYRIVDGHRQAARPEEP